MEHKNMRKGGKEEGHFSWLQHFYEGCKMKKRKDFEERGYGLKSGLCTLGFLDESEIILNPDERNCPLGNPVDRAYQQASYPGHAGL